jgi:hypothetical protein
MLLQVQLYAKLLVGIGHAATSKDGACSPFLHTYNVGVHPAWGGRSSRAIQDSVCGWGDTGLDALASLHIQPHIHSCRNTRTGNL